MNEMTVDDGCAPFRDIGSPRGVQIGGIKNLRGGGLQVC